jgi:hypothetical protein
MKSDSCRMDRSTATAATSARSRNVGSAGTSFHRAWEAKNVAKRIETAAASRALAVTG